MSGRKRAFPGETGVKEPHRSSTKVLYCRNTSYAAGDSYSECIKSIYLFGDRPRSLGGARAASLLRIRARRRAWPSSCRTRRTLVASRTVSLIFHSDDMSAEAPLCAILGTCICRTCKHYYLEGIYKVNIILIVVVAKSTRRPASPAAWSASVSEFPLTAANTFVRH